MKAKSIKGSSASAIQSALHESMADGFKPTLAIVFLSIKQDRKAISEILNNEGIDIFGATTAGEFIDEHQSQGEIAILLLDIKKDNYCILMEEIGNRNLSEAIVHIADIAKQKFSKPGLILSATIFSGTGKLLDGNTVVKKMEEVLGSGVSMFGGMAGDDITFTGTHVFTKNRSTDYGLLVLVLDEEKINMHGMAISGWKPMGVTRTATKTDENLIYTIDDLPALETYLRYLGKDVSTAEDQVKFFESISVHYPFLIEREGRYPKICGPIGYDKEKKALICESYVPQGSRFRFSTPPDFEIVDTVISKANEFRSELNADADALLIFSCAGRLSALGPMAQLENEGLQQVWNVPMAGFYTYGEFGKGLDGKHEFHSSTNSWVALKEK
jgi:hypothetical protein